MKAESLKVPDLLLEQYALGELRAADRERVAVALEYDPELRERLERLRASDAQIMEEMPPAEIAASIRRRMLSSASSSAASAGFAASAGAGRGPGARDAGAPGSSARPGSRGVRRFGGPRPAPWVSFSAAAAALVLVGLVFGRSLFLPPSSDDITRAKGGAPGLVVYKKAAGGPVVLADGERVSPGDVLQIKYAAGTARYAVIASLDGSGTITWHLPANYPGGDSGSPRIDEAGSALGSAYELDDAPSFERFFIVSSKNSFNVATAAKAIRELSSSGSADSGALRLPSGLEWRSFLVLKSGGDK